MQLKMFRFFLSEFVRNLSFDDSILLPVQHFLRPIRTWRLEVGGWNGGSEMNLVHMFILIHC